MAPARTEAWKFLDDKFLQTLRGQHHCGLIDVPIDDLLDQESIYHGEFSYYDFQTNSQCPGNPIECQYLLFVSRIWISIELKAATISHFQIKIIVRERLWYKHENINKYLSIYSIIIRLDFIAIFILWHENLTAWSSPFIIWKTWTISGSSNSCSGSQVLYTKGRADCCWNCTKYDFSK